MVVGGEAERASTLQFVLEAPAEEGRLLGHFAGPGVLVVFIVGQTDHGVSLRQVSAEGGTLGRLDRWTHRQNRFVFNGIHETPEEHANANTVELKRDKGASRGQLGGLPLKGCCPSR